MNYAEVQARLCTGWNTWNTWSVLSHVLLPDGLAINLSLKEYRSGRWLREALIGRKGANDEIIYPGPHAYDGSYTELRLVWQGVEAIIQSAHTEDGELVLLITPVRNQRRPAVLMADMGFLWNRPGTVCREGAVLCARSPQRTVELFSPQCDGDEISVASLTPHITMQLAGPVGLSTGRKRSVEEIREIVGRAQSALVDGQKARFGEKSEMYAAMQSCLAWDTIYEPQKGRVITPVSRLWNVSWGGDVLVDWDTYFASSMISMESRDLAYANAVEITRESRELGFVPNDSGATGKKSRDRSQPPVGSRTVLELYRKFGDRWLLELLFDDLLSWNRWYFEHRHVGGGMMAFGSNPYEPRLDNEWELNGVNDRFGAALESGLDNSPMYDDVPFDKERHVLCQSDVGLTGLYAMDCRALAEMAQILGRGEEQELRDRLALAGKGVQRMWDEEKGFFYNLRTDTGEFSRRISPTNFYALFADGLREEQVRRVIDGHLMNEEEFFGEWMLPSIARNDPAYQDQEYWRGRIWAPLNYLVYLAFCDQGQEAVCKLLAEKSGRLLLKEWLARGWVCENYDADTGSGEVRERIVDGKVVSYGGSDRFYSWGGLLGYIALME